MDIAEDVKGGVRAAAIRAADEYRDRTGDNAFSLTFDGTMELLSIAILAERERCAKVCEAQKQEFLSPQYASNQPLGSMLERFACDECASAIRSGER